MSTAPMQDTGIETDRNWKEERGRSITLIEALSIARKSVAELSGLPVDSIASSETGSDGGWTVTVDVLEGAARIGENDLLASYQVQIGSDGALTGFTRTRRYRREEGGAG